MTITSILEYDKRKVLVQLDEHFIFPLYKGEVKKYRLVQGEEITEETYSEIMGEVLPKRVKLRAMNLLMKRSYTRERLRCKLAEGKYPDDLIEEALDYVTSYNYLDDFRYAEEYIRCYCDSRSKRRIMQDLYTKGVSSEVAEKAWTKYEMQNEAIDETEQIMKLLRKKKFDAASADRKETAKIMSFLYRKGYSMDSIMRCMQCDEF